MKISRRTSGVALICAVGAAASVMALAQGGALPFLPDGKIAGCYSTGGALKVRTPLEPNCPKGYAPIEWNATGPAGAQGPAGPAGQIGPTGPTGPQGPAGASQIYWTQNAHVVYTTGSAIQIAGLSNLPAGNYLFFTTVTSATYQPSPDDIHYRAPVICQVYLNGQATQLADAIIGGGSFLVGELNTATEVVPLTVPANSLFDVRCRASDGTHDKTVAKVRVIAQLINAIN